MTRLISAMKTDVTVQVRSNLYTIGISAAAVIAVVLGWLGPATSCRAGSRL